ncbi:MAG TPA: OmpA family protein [Bryobacteraceae bacterium]|jgi:outer membrane protein OmpA-like peptidoglycan-associated protein|nr:OmpA family protein [Bryobacteraceae bacterium]
MKVRNDTKYGLLLGLVAILPVFAADVPGSKDPAGVKRYTGSEIIGYRAPKFDELVLPLGPPTDMYRPAYTKSLNVEGLISRYGYLAPEGRTPTELFRNYQLEFQRLGLVTLYQKAAGEPGWFGPTMGHVEDEDGLGQILSYNQDQERVLVAKTKDAQPTYYYCFVTAFRDGVIPDRLRPEMTKGRALAELIVITPQAMEQNMTLLNSEDMSKALGDSGKVALYGINFDTDKDTLRSDSEPTLKEIAKLLTTNPGLKIRVVGHTDNQGKSDYNLDLSRRRAAAVVHELNTKYGIAANRLDSFGCGLYAPAASNDSEDGRTKNRRVELVKW